MIRNQGSVLQGIALEAVRHGADTIEVKYKDGYEQVFAIGDGVGYGIARLDRKKRRVIIGEVECELRARVYDSFGDDAFQVKLRRI